MNLERVIHVLTQIGRIVTRVYEDAAFAYNVRTGASVFVEGTISKLLPEVLVDNELAMNAFLEEVPDKWKKVAEQDLEDIRAKARDVTGIEERVSNGEYFATDEDSPLAMLSKYAVEKWQPINATIELTYRCNLRCKYCYLDDHLLPGLSKEKLLEIGCELKEAGLAFVLFTGGETFIRPDTLDVMRGYKDLGFALEAKSNGLLLDEAKITEIAELEIFNLQISVYGFQDGPSSLVGGNYHFSKLRDNIKALTSAGVPVSLSVLVGKHNIGDLSSYEKALRDLDVIEVSYTPYLTPRRDGDRAVTELRLSRQEMEEKMKPFLSENGGFITPTKYRDCKCDSPLCYAGRDQIAIDPHGNVHPCLDFRFPMGDITTSPLSDILNGRQALLEPFTLGKMQKCMDCSIVEYCDSCPGVSLLELGDYVAPVSHKCDVAHFYWNATRSEGR